MTQTVKTPAVSPDVVQLEPRHVAVIDIVGQAADLPVLLPKAFQATMEHIAMSGAQVVGPPFARYLTFGERIEAEVGFPYVGTLLPDERIHDAVLPGGRAVSGTLVGPYDEIGAAWALVGGWLSEHGLVGSGAPWESYLTGPDDPGPPVTQIVFPIR